MKKIIHLTLFLAIISAIAGGALATVNGITEPIIRENAMKEVQSTIDEFFPNGNFNEGSIKGDAEYILNVYEDSNKGVVYKSSIQGFKAQIVFLLAIDTDGNFAGFKVTESQETQGFGTRVGEPEFYDTFVGQPIDTQVDTLSGATVSSSAVVKAIDEIVAYHQANY